MENEEFEKHLMHFETVEPSGATDRKVLETARKHVFEQLGARRKARRSRSLAVVALLALTVEAVFFLALGIAPETVAYGGVPKGGMLAAIDPKGRLLGVCPLRHTSVEAEISGFVARVTLKQVFHNPFKDKIEAVYTFPLSAGGAVDSMLMKVGDRVIRGVIKRRETARRIYERARASGKTAALLDQERPNIFTQSLANIRPGERIEITIKYVEMLPYEDGKFTFSFPMVVGPRFIPGQPTGESGTGWSPDTTQVPDASRITPPVTPPRTRAGHDIDLTVKLNAGVPVTCIKSKLHKVEIKHEGKGKTTIALTNKRTIPNKDFVLEYTVAGEEVKSGCLIHKNGKYGYLTIILLPPERPKREQIAPREMIFVVDRSGSQSGLPIEKAKETMGYILEWMNPNDTFNIISFSNGLEVLFESPRKKSTETLGRARKYIASLYGNGGTYMAPAIVKACENPAPENRLRIVTFMTDGYIGNDFTVLGLVKKLRGSSRWFAFGTGNSVNRFLLDNMAKLGGGEVEYILLNSPGEEVARKFYNRISTPILTDVRVEFEGLEVEDRHPDVVSDLWARRPLYFHARYKKAGKGAVVLKGFLGGKPYEQRLEIELPQVDDANEVLGSVWARAKVDSLMEENLMRHQVRTPAGEIKEEIIRVALEHHIMTQYTSFVAVEEKVRTDPEKKPRKVPVPVEMPDGVSRKGVFGPTGMPKKRPKTAGAPTNTTTQYTLVHDPESRDFTVTSEQSNPNSPVARRGAYIADYDVSGQGGLAPIEVGDPIIRNSGEDIGIDYRGLGNGNSTIGRPFTVTSAQGNPQPPVANFSASPTAGSAPPAACFTASVTSGDAPLTVNFTDLSTNDVTTWEWDFDNDDETSVPQNPSHTYSSAGTYTVKLTVTGPSGSDSEIKVDYSKDGGANWNTAAKTIQQGLSYAEKHDWKVAVADGTYRGVKNKDLDFGGRRIHLYAENGGVVEGFTILNGSVPGLADAGDDGWRVVTLASERQAHKNWALVLCIFVCIALAGAVTVILLRRRGRTA